MDKPTQETRSTTDDTRTAGLGHWLAFLTYALVGTCMLAPALSALRTHVVGRPDLHVWEELWHFWWTRQAVLSGQSIFSTPMLGFPNEFNVFYDMSSVSLPLVSVPLQPVFGLTGAYNILALAALVAGAFGTYRVCYVLAGRRLESFVGGAIFGFSPFLQTELTNGMMENVFAFAMLPWILLLTLALVRRPTWKAAVGCGLLVAFAALASWYILPAALLLLALVWIFERDRDVPAGRFWTALALYAGIVIVLLAWPVMMLLRGPALERGISFADCVHPSMISKSCPDLLSLVTHPPATAPVDGQAPLPFGTYAGKLVVFFAFLACLTRRPRWRAWKIGALTFLLLALGPYLNVGGRVNWLGNFRLPLPGRLLAYLPGGLRIFALHNYRFLAGFMLIAAILAALVMARFTTVRQLGLRARTAAAVVLTWLVLVDFATALRDTKPLLLPSTPAAVPDAIVRLQALPPGAILHVPVTFGSAGLPHIRGLQMFYQTHHHRPIWCDPIWITEPPANEPQLIQAAREAAAKRDWTWDATTTTRELGALYDEGFRYIILDRSQLTRDHAVRFSTMLFKQLGNPVINDDRMEVYALGEGEGEGEGE